MIGRLIAMLFVAAQAIAGPTLGNTSHSSTFYSTSLTWSHTVTSNNNRVLIVCVGLYHPDSASSSGVTFNGVSMTLVKREHTSLQGTTEIYKLVNPNSGAHNVVVSVNTGWSADAIVGGVGIDFYDAADAGVGSSAHGFSTNGTVSGIASATSEYVIQNAVNINGNFNALGAGQTLAARDSNNAVHMIVSYKTSSGASESVSTTYWTNSDWSTSAVSVSAGSGGAPTQSVILIGALYEKKKPVARQ